MYKVGKSKEKGPHHIVTFGGRTLSLPFVVLLHHARTEVLAGHTLLDIS